MSLQIENGIKIVENAIKNKISLVESCAACNFGPNYVYNVENRIR